MFFPRKMPIVLAFSALSALAAAVGCSREDEGVEGASSDFTTAGALQDLVISQVYGGGGNNGAKYTHDYVELFNQSDHEVELAGKTLQYVSSGASFTKAKNLLTLPPTTAKLGPGQYFLIQLATGATAGATPVGAALTDVDYMATQPLELISMSKETGKLALVATADDAIEGCGAPGTPCDGAKLLDLVAYGPSASQFRGVAPAPALSTATAAIRRFGGCAHSGDNSLDFEAAEPAPRNGKTPASPLCATVDASAPPPPPPSTDGGDAGDGGTKTDAGKTDAGKTDAGKADAGPKPPKTDAGTHGTKDGGSSGTTAGDDDDDTSPVDPGDGDDDDDAKPTPKKPTSTMGNGATAQPPSFPATSPSCSAGPRPVSSSGGLAAALGLALACAALRRRR